jgi:hypothetical protein
MAVAEVNLERLLDSDGLTLEQLQAAVFAHGLPDHTRAAVWRMLLNHEPVKRSERASQLAASRQQYRMFVRELATMPDGVVLTCASAEEALGPDEAIAAVAVAAAAAAAAPRPPAVDPLTGAPMETVEPVHHHEQAAGTSASYAVTDGATPRPQLAPASPDGSMADRFRTLLMESSSADSPVTNGADRAMAAGDGASRGVAEGAAAGGSTPTEVDACAVPRPAAAAVSEQTAQAEVLTATPKRKGGKKKQAGKKGGAGVDGGMPSAAGGDAEEELAAAVAAEAKAEAAVEAAVVTGPAPEPLQRTAAGSATKPSGVALSTSANVVPTTPAGPESEPPSDPRGAPATVLGCPVACGGAGAMPIDAAKHPTVPLTGPPPATDNDGLWAAWLRDEPLRIEIDKVRASAAHFDD